MSFRSFLQVHAHMLCWHSDAISNSCVASFSQTYWVGLKGSWDTGTVSRAETVGQHTLSRVTLWGTVRVSLNACKWTKLFKFQFKLVHEDSNKKNNQLLASWTYCKHSHRIHQSSQVCRHRTEPSQYILHYHTEVYHLGKQARLSPSWATPCVVL